MDKVEIAKTIQINEWLASLGISAYSLKGVFKRTPQQIHTAINSNPSKYPTLKNKIYSYLNKRIDAKKELVVRG